MESQGLPIHRGYYIEDQRELELAWWPLRECNTAFVQLMGMEGVNELRVSEIAPGKTLPPFKLGVDEIVYVLEGRGLTTVWSDEGRAKKTFEWEKYSMFMIPRHYHHQLCNTQGDRPVKLMHYNYLPVALSATEDPEFFFNNSFTVPESADNGLGNLYAEAKVMKDTGGTMGARNVWYGNFFPDMRAWDRLDPFKGRGAGGHVVWIQFAGSEASCHMSVFPAKTYKKGHRHGPGRAIVIPTGEGYSVMWPEGGEKVVVPWHEASLFTPPNRWFHQHFNVAGVPGRYLALHPLPQFSGHAEKVQDRAKDQIEYPDEEPWIRQKFEEELAKRSLKSMMPDEAYRDKNFEWTY
jgi:mannose-6-phosphate isomerase-like protein (cupin superfamily)